MAPPRLSKLQKVGVSLALMCAIDVKRTRKRRKWMNDWLKERLLMSHNNVSADLLDYSEIFNLLRMDKETFDELLEMVRPHIQKVGTHMRPSVSAEERLLTTLTFVATGRDYRDLRFSAVVSHQLLSQIIPETCRAIYKVLEDTIKLPSTEEEWKDCAKLFETQWQLPNCVGCLDGRHIQIHKPRGGSGSLYYNHKGMFSVVLFAIVNANYQFMYVHTDAGANGSTSDGSIIKNTTFYKKLSDKELGLPESCELPRTNISVPYVFAGDSAFALETHIMTPFPQTDITNKKKIFNYRLSGATGIAEIVFGIFASRFSIFKNPIQLKLENIHAIVLACCALHNFLCKKSKTYMNAPNLDREDFENFTINQADWGSEAANQMTPLQKNLQRPSSDGNQIRDILTNYFNGAGRVSFQDKMANSFHT